MKTADTEVVDLSDVVASIAGMVEVCWEIGLAGIMRDGKTREQAELELVEVWHRCSLRLERPWVDPVEDTEA